MPVRDYSGRPDILEAARQAADTMLACWSEWEQFADKEAHDHGNNAGFDVMHSQIECVLLGMLDNIDQL